MRLFRPSPSGSPERAQARRALITVFAVWFPMLGMALLFGAPDWLTALIFFGYPVVFLGVGIVIRARANR